MHIPPWRFASNEKIVLTVGTGKNKNWTVYLTDAVTGAPWDITGLEFGAILKRSKSSTTVIASPVVDIVDASGGIVSVAWDGVDLGSEPAQDAVFAIYQIVGGENKSIGLEATLQLDGTVIPD